MYFMMVIPEGTRFVFFSDGGDQNDAIRCFKAIKHSIRRGDLDLGVLGPGRSASSRSLFSYRFRLPIKGFGLFWASLGFLMVSVLDSFSRVGRGSA